MRVGDHLELKTDCFRRNLQVPIPSITWGSDLQACRRAGHSLAAKPWAVVLTLKRRKKGIAAQ
jgi:hypothetical protein